MDPKHVAVRVARFLENLRAEYSLLVQVWTAVPRVEMFLRDMVYQGVPGHEFLVGRATEALDCRRRVKSAFDVVRLEVHKVVCTARHVELLITTLQ